MMNNDHPNMNRSGRADETAQDIFARIQQRRATAVNGARNERSAPRQESTSGEAQPAGVAGESLADILRRAAAKEASAPRGAASVHEAEHERAGTSERGASPGDTGRSTSARSGPYTGSKYTGSKNNSAFRHFGGGTPGHHSRPPVDYPLLVDEDGTPIDEHAPHGRDDGVPRDSFPRSKTMRALLRYPTLTTAVGLAVAVPMATLVLRTPAARQTLLRIGKFAAEQEVWKHVRRLTK